MGNVGTCEHCGKRAELFELAAERQTRQLCDECHIMGCEICGVVDQYASEGARIPIMTCPDCKTNMGDYGY